MTTPSETTQLQRAALVSGSGPTSVRCITFQYNPETVRVTIEPNTVGGKPGSRSRSVRFAGAATQTLTLDCRFSSAGATETAGDAEVAKSGIAPALAALTLLAYPSTVDVAAAQALLEHGRIEVIPQVADELRLVLGSRIIPCEIQSMSIVEQLYDNQLVPILATVTLSLRALSYSDVGPSDPAYSDFLMYQRSLEKTAGDAYDSWSGPA